jgi:5-methylcytosine-specific restriction endonuclease McrA
VNKRLRFAVLERDDFTCQYCGRRPPEVRLEVDHLEPRARGGKDGLWNLVTACWDCNRGKGAAWSTLAIFDLRRDYEAMRADYLYAIQQMADLADRVEQLEGEA